MVNKVIDRLTVSARVRAGRITDSRMVSVVFLLSFALTLATLAGSQVKASDPGVFPDRIVFGQTGPFSGRTERIANSLAWGIRAAFDEVNSQGGINGRRLELLSKDDAYNPAKTKEIAQSFIDSNEIFAFIGSVGTPTGRVTAALADQYGLPFISPYTGAEFLRSKQRYGTVVNLRPAYSEETKAWIEYLTGIGIDRIAVFYRDDAYGRTGLRGVMQELRKRELLLAARGSHARNLTVASSAVWDIRQAEPQAIGIVSSYAATSSFIRNARLQGLNPKFVSLSAVGSEALIDELGDDAQGVLISQVMPSTNDHSVPLVAQFNRAMDAYAMRNDLDSDSWLSYIAFEGYLAARFVIQVLQSADEGEPTRKALLDHIFDTQEFEIGGIDLHFEEGQNQGLHTVYMTEVGRNNQIVVLDSIDVRD
ncbi:MAG: ABC transporter substrate-binding protein [Acidiferrobacterales bacterium]|nr:ABC transporter substrate-binding protein [Acidiferrobacterales bacterium]